MKALSGELDYRIRYDVEHDLFHAQNVFNDEYIKPTFIEYVQKLEKENAELKGEADSVLDNWCKGNDPCPHLKKRDEQLAKAKEIIRELLTCARNYPESNKQKMQKAEQFLNSEMKMTEDDFLERVDNGFN